MGNNPRSLSNTPGIIPQIAQLAAMVGTSPSGYPGAIAATIGVGNPNAMSGVLGGSGAMNTAVGIAPNLKLQDLKSFYSNVAGGANIYRELGMGIGRLLGIQYNQMSAADPTGMFDPKDPNSAIRQQAQSLLTENNYMSNVYSPYQQIQAGARPDWIAMNDVMKSLAGYSAEDIKTEMISQGYQFVPTGGGGIFVGGGDGSTPIGNAPGAGYTWSNGAWHAPAGEDPYSDIRSVKMGKRRGWVTPEVADLLARRRRRRITEAFESGTHPTQQAKQEPSQSAMQAGGTVAGLVNFRASFG